MEQRLHRDGSSKPLVLITSILFMGLSHILYFKDYIKGILFGITELLMLVYLPTAIMKVSNLITLGSPQPSLPVKERDNSMFMLIDGVVMVIVLLVFLIIYIISVRSAMSQYGYYCTHGKLEATTKKNGMSEKAFVLFGLTPTVGLILFFVFVPLVFSACVAFTNYSTPSHIPPNNTVDWVGLENFAYMFGGGATWTSALVRVILWTLTWAVCATATCYLGGMIMAVVLQENKIRFKGFFRTICILPYAVPAVLSMLVWRNLLNGSFGIINRTLTKIGVINSAIPWLSDEWLSKFMCVLINLWAGFPYFMLLIMGTMTAISPDIFDAARIDGSTKWNVFKRITLPLVLYQTMPLIIMSFTHNINNFGAIFFLTGGEPKIADTTATSAGGTDILVTWIYKLTVNLMKYNYASVIAVMIFVALAPIAIWNFRRTKSYKEGEL